MCRKTSHGVPFERLETMLARFEHNVTVDSVLNPKAHKKKIKATTSNLAADKEGKRSQSKDVESKTIKDARKDVVEETIISSAAEQQDCQAGDTCSNSSEECPVEEDHTSTSDGSSGTRLDSAQTGNLDIIDVRTLESEAFGRSKEEQISDSNDAAPLNESNTETDPGAEMTDIYFITEVSEGEQSMPNVQAVQSVIPSVDAFEENDTDKVDVSILASCKEVVHEGSNQDQNDDGEEDEEEGEDGGEEEENFEDVQPGMKSSSHENNLLNGVVSTSVSREQETSERPKTQENVLVNNVDALQRARQYAVEITKKSGAKYTDAPCSKCADKINCIDADCNVDEISSDMNEAIPQHMHNGIDTEHASNDGYHGNQELSLEDAVSTEMNHRQTTDDQDERNSTVGKEADDNIDQMVQLEEEEVVVVDEEEPEHFEDASLIAESSSEDTSDSLPSPDPPIPALSETDSLAIPVEASKSKSSHRHSPHTPRLAAVFSEAFQSLQDVVDKTTTDWTFPDHRADSAADGNHVANPEVNIAQSSDVEFVECSCQTEHEDFAILQKIESGKLSETEASEMGMSVLTGCSNMFFCTHVMEQQKSDLDTSGDAGHDDIPSVRKLDQSTMTAAGDTRRERSVSSSLQDLQSVFPYVPIESLQGVLDDCGRDVEWATNILIDSGYTDTDEEHSINDVVVEDKPVDEEDRQQVLSTDDDETSNIPQDEDQMTTSSTFPHTQADTHLDTTIQESRQSMDDLSVNTNIITDQKQTNKYLEQHFNQTCTPSDESRSENVQKTHDPNTSTLSSVPYTDISSSHRISQNIPSSLQGICHARLLQIDEAEPLSSLMNTTSEELCNVSETPKSEKDEDLAGKANGSLDHCKTNGPLDSDVEGRLDVKSDSRSLSDQVRGHGNNIQCKKGLPNEDNSQQQMPCNVDHPPLQPNDTISAYERINETPHTTSSKLKPLAKELAHQSKPAARLPKNVPSASNDSAVVTVPMELILAPACASANLQYTGRSVHDKTERTSRNLSSLEKCTMELNSDLLSDCSVVKTTQRSKSPASTGLKLLTKAYTSRADNTLGASDDTDGSSLESSPKTQQSSELYTDEDDGGDEDDDDDDDDDDLGGTGNCRDVLGLDDGVVLQLDAAFALQLQEMFGPVGFHLSPGKLKGSFRDVKANNFL